jgi:hypothetical protein
LKNVPKLHQALFAIICFLNSLFFQNLVTFVHVCYLYKINNTAILDFCCFDFPLPPAITKIILKLHPLSYIAPQAAQSRKGQYRLYILEIHACNNPLPIFLKHRLVLPRHLQKTDETWTLLNTELSISKTYKVGILFWFLWTLI